MNELKKALPIILAHYILGLVFCFLWFFIKSTETILIQPFVTSYKIGQALLLFTRLIPPLFISGIVLGYSIAFGKFQDSSIKRWSTELLESLKGAFILSIVTVSLFIIFAEGFSPFIKSKVITLEQKSSDYESNMTLSNFYISTGDYVEAELHAQAALLIWKKSIEANTLLNSAQYLASDQIKSVLSSQNQQSQITPNSEPSALNLTTLSALEIAKSYLETEDYFSAHYYAMLAQKISEPADPNKQIALRTAAEAWNALSTMPDTYEVRTDSRLFSIKRKGYEAIQREDWVNAYYIFTSLKEDDSLKQDKKYDPDIDRLLKIAETGLYTTHYFLEETFGIEPFESYKNNFFIIKHPNNTTSVIFFKGISYKKESGKDMAYLRDFEYAKINPMYECEFHIATPYAKLIPFITETKETIPLIQLKSIDRGHNNREILPIFIYGEPSNIDRNVLLLNMPYSDLSLILSANRGVKAMTLTELLQFNKKAELYGFSRAVIQHETIYRLSQPFLILILSVFAIIIAWKFRFSPKILFKAWWSIIVPIIPTAAWFVVETARYMISLLSIPVIAWFPNTPEIIMLVSLTVTFIAISITFFAQRGD